MHKAHNQLKGDKNGTLLLNIIDDSFNTMDATLKKIRREMHYYQIPYVIVNYKNSLVNVYKLKK